jgi:uncharacterized coiled-coil protein SlyX
MSFAQINTLIAAAERKQAEDYNTIGELNVNLMWARADVDGLQKEVKMLREIISAQQPAAAPVVQLCLAEKKRAYHLKNRVACACGGVSSNTESTKKIHEAGKQHVDYIQQQAALAVAVAAASTPNSEDAKREKREKINEAMREKNRSMVKGCLCGGKTTCDKVRRERHEGSQMHQAWAAENEQYSDASDE